MLAPLHPHYTHHTLYGAILGAEVLLLSLTVPPGAQEGGEQEKHHARSTGRSRGAAPTPAVVVPTLVLGQPDFLLPGLSGAGTWTPLSLGML